jgi:hypothetical protein
MNKRIKRWSLVNTKTNKMSRTFTTRDAARAAKTPNQRIFDTVNLAFVR